jgi:hypothetical protein
LDFPRYDGKSDPLIFINRCESYFRQQRTMPEEKVWMASYNLEEVAQLWFIQLQEDEGTPPWGRFKELLNLRFGPVLRSAPLFELSECCRTGTVEEYSNRFQALLPRAGRLEEGQRVQLYTGGLLPSLSHQVRIHAPETLTAAMSLARALELVDLDRLNTIPGKRLCLLQTVANVRQELGALLHGLGNGRHPGVPGLIRPDGGRITAVDHAEGGVPQRSLVGRVEEELRPWQPPQPLTRPISC